MKKFASTIVIALVASAMLASPASAKSGTKCKTVSASASVNGDTTTKKVCKTKSGKTYVVKTASAGLR